MDLDRKLIGQRLRARRQSLDLSLGDIRARTGLSRSFLSDIERGEGRPSVESLARIAAAVDMSLPDLFTPAGAAAPVDLKRLLRDGDARVTYDGRPLTAEERANLLQMIDAALDLQAAGRRPFEETAEIEQFAAHMAGEYGRPPSPELQALIRAIVREVRAEVRGREANGPGVGGR